MWDGVAPPLSVSCLLPPARYIKTVYHQVQLYNNCTVVVIVNNTVVSTLDNSRQVRKQERGGSAYGSKLHGTVAKNQ